MTSEPAPAGPVTPRRVSSLFLAFVFVSNCASGLYTLSVAKFLFDRTGSVAAFGAVLIAEYMIGLLLQGYAGTVVDRGRPIRLLVGANLARAGLTATMTFALLVWGDVSTAAALVAFIGFQLCSPFFRAAYFVVPKAIATDDALVALHGQLAAVYQCGQLVGMALAGLLLGRGQAVAMGITATCFLLSTAVLPSVARSARSLAGARAHGSPWWVELARRGRWLLRERPGVVVLLLIGSLDFLTVGLVNLVLVPLVARDYGGSSVHLAAFDAAFALGAIAGGVVIARVPRLAPAFLSGTGLLVTGACLLALGEPNAAIGHALGFAVAGAVVSAAVAAFSAEVQRRTPDGIAGTISAFRFMTIALVSSSGIALFSLGQQADLQFATRAAGVAYVALFVVVACMTRISRARERALWSAPEAARRATRQ